MSAETADKCLATYVSLFLVPYTGILSHQHTLVMQNLHSVLTKGRNYTKESYTYRWIASCETWITGKSIR